jgi:hypothetical protein
MADGFLGRWSKRKAGIDIKQDSSLEKKAETPREASSIPPAEKPSEEVVPPATLEDVAKIDRFDPDFSAFMKPDVDPAVQQAALKKMFTDPHFNIMDGLDIYIDDYSKPDPLPPGMLERMVQSDMLKLFRNSAEEESQQNTSQATNLSKEDDGLLTQQQSDLTSTQQIQEPASPLDVAPDEVSVDPKQKKT